jgi:hypothetical protein
LQAVKFRVTSAFIGMVGVLVLGAAPAYAVSPGNAGSNCVTHSCDAWAAIGATPPGSGGGTTVVLPPPPPCQVAPVGDARSGSQTIISFYQGSGTVAQPTDAASDAASASASASAAPTASALDQQDQKILSQAQQLVNTNPVPVGEWYQVVATTPADQPQCNNLPLFIWQPGHGNGALLKVGLDVPLGTLAALIYQQLNLAKIGSVVLSPQADSDTNLPTFIQVALTPGLDSPLFLTADGDPYVVATAETRLGAATVWAKAASLTINPGTPDAKTFNEPTQCTQAHPGPDGNTIMLGSRYSAKQMAAAGAGANIDCGVTYGAPGSYNLTVSVNWTACWVAGPPTPGGPPQTGCNQVPGAAALQPSTSGPVPVNVRSITAIN